MSPHHLHSASAHHHLHGTLAHVTSAWRRSSALSACHTVPYILCIALHELHGTVRCYILHRHVANTIFNKTVSPCTTCMAPQLCIVCMTHSLSLLYSGSSKQAFPTCRWIHTWPIISAACSCKSATAWLHQQPSVQPLSPSKA